jgi:hypothetical protein
MAVIQCPICKEFLVGYNWAKTKTGKNWLKNKDDTWHSCPNKKFAKKTASSHKKKYGRDAQQGLDLYPKFDSNEAGYYCTHGHFVSSTPPLEKYCVVCDTPLSVMLIENQGH